eukprot:m.1165909 g.1165909  ORF g.1165909 m.1165909 type:complete len:62 (+) comp24504_c0_seq1:1132-1317(+)
MYHGHASSRKMQLRRASLDLDNAFSLQKVFISCESGQDVTMVTEEAAIASTASHHRLVVRS